MIDKLNHHYALENPSSIYDEEALTALELAGRTTHKVNEVVDYVNGMDKMIDTEVENHIKSGDFDNQISKNLNNLNQRVNNLLGTLDVGSTTADAELIDIRVGFNRQTYDNAGNAVRGQIKELGNVVGRSSKPGTIIVDNWLDGFYYSTTNGNIGIDDIWKCSASLLPCAEGVIFVSPEDTNDLPILLVCYDEDMNLLGRCYVTNSNTKDFSPCQCTYKGTAWIGVNVGSQFTGEALRLVPLTNEGLMYIDHNDIMTMPENVLALENYAVQAGGVPIASDGSVDCFYMPANGIKKVFVHGVAKFNVVCFNMNNQVIQTGQTGNTNEYESVTTQLTEGQKETGRIYNVPTNTAYMAINFVNSLYWGGNTEQKCSYCSFIRDDMSEKEFPLMGKRVLAIGDSITYLDGMGSQSYDNSYGIRGWQSELRKRGAIVTTWGFNGRPYATSENGGIGMAELIVGGSLDVTPYDCVVLFGGTNDVYYDVPIGNLKDTHFSIYRSYENFSNALSYICHYILSNNPDCEIFLCSMLPSAALERVYSKVMTYYNRLVEMSKYWCVPFIDMYRSGICMPGLNHESAYYDTTHPKVPTMSKIGKIIARHMELYTR